jgi:hypothetical protein
MIVHGAAGHRYRVMGIPPPLFKDGREVGHHVGATSEAVLRQERERLSGAVVQQ